MKLYFVLLIFAKKKKKKKKNRIEKKDRIKSAYANY